MCGWLLPGPCKAVWPLTPAAIAICPAVWPLPYSFVLVDAAAACVSWDVVLAGLTPA